MLMNATDWVIDAFSYGYEVYDNERKFSVFSISFISTYCSIHIHVYSIPDIHASKSPAQHPSHDSHHRLDFSLKDYTYVQRAYGKIAYLS